MSNIDYSIATIDKLKEMEKACYQMIENSKSGISVAENLLREVQTEIKRRHRILERQIRVFVRPPRYYQFIPTPDRQVRG